MNFNELSLSWKQIFELDWSSICGGSKAIAAVITDESGEIINKISARLEIFGIKYIN